MENEKNFSSSVISRHISLQQQRFKRNIWLVVRVTSQCRCRRNVIIKYAPSNWGCETLNLKFMTRGTISRSQLSIFPFLDGDVPLVPSYGVHISQLVRSDLNERNLCITEKLLSQGFRYHKLIKTFAMYM